MVMRGGQTGGMEENSCGDGREVGGGMPGRCGMLDCLILSPDSLPAVGLAA